jgi:hypothetical protein
MDYLVLILRSIAKRCVSKDGNRVPWFETRGVAALLTMRVELFQVGTA